MNRLWIHAIFALGLSLLHAQSTSSVFTIPPKPISQVSDESAWFSPSEKKVWEKQLTDWKTRDGVEIFLVVLKDLRSLPAEHVSREISHRWGNPKFCGVLLYVIGSGTPQIWWDGEIVEKIQLDPRAKREMILRMEKRAASELSELDKIHSAAHQLSDTMRVINSQWKQLSFIRDKWNDSVYRHWAAERLKRRSQLIALISISSVVLLITAVLFRRYWQQRQVYHFPRISARRRFAAPHGGGSGAVISYVTTPESR
jgi:hypothetical protein